MNKELEQVYIDDIHPLVERISLICKQSGMPMFMTFQDSPDGFRTSCLNAENDTFKKVQMHYWLHETWGLDEFMNKIIHDARINGHQSLYLKAMGIIEKPETIKSFPKRK
jgi:hypothetical protein